MFLQTERKAKIGFVFRVWAESESKNRSLSERKIKIFILTYGKIFRINHFQTHLTIYNYIYGQPLSFNFLYVIITDI